MIEDNTFDNNSTGAAINSSMSPDIFHNTFKVPGNSNNTAFPIGLQLENCFSYTVSENTFDKCTSCSTLPDGSIGVTLHNQHGNDEKVYKNNFDNLRYSSMAQQINDGTSGGVYTGLQFICNDYQSNNILDIVRNSIYSVDGYTGTIQGATIRQKQGVCLNMGSTAGNRFYNTCGGNTHLAHDGYTTQPVDYYFLNTGTDYDPQTCVDIHYSTYSCTTPPGSHSAICPSLPVYGTGSGILPLVRSTLDSIDGVLDTMSTLNDGYNDCVTFQHLSVNDMAACYVATDNLDSAGYLMYNNARYNEAMQFFMAAEMWTNAWASWDNLPMVTSDDSVYQWITGKALSLYSVDSTWKSLDSLGRDSIDKKVSFDKNSGVLAYATHCIVNDTAYMFTTPVFTPPIDKKGVTGNNNVTITDGRQPAQRLQTEQFKVFPNPTTGSFSVRSDERGILKLYSVDERLVGSFTIVKGRTNLDMPDGLTAGVYIAKMTSESNKLHIVRLIYKP